MIDRDELRALLLDLESDRIERTVAVGKIDKYCEAVCAFANDFPDHKKPGYLVIGADNSGKILDARVDDALIAGLGGIRSDGNVLPSPALSVGKYSFPEGDLAVVEVLPSDLPPVRYKGQVYIRVGPRKAIATEQEERILSERRIARARSFDALPCADALLEDLALRLFEDYRALAVEPEVISANHRSVEEQLASLRFFDLGLGRPSVAGILLFGFNPRHFLPGCYVQFVRFPGTDLFADPLDQREISGDLLTLVNRLHDLVRAHNRVALKREGFAESPAPDYPIWALRELLHNAVMHRDYQSNTPIRFYWFADRIEIQSPGGLFGEVTAETLEKRNSYRNPVVAEAMKTFGFVNRFGYGIQRAQAELRQSGNPPAEFVIEDRVFRVTLRSKT